jgi:c-di-GMP-binding flagellar brake protein YcgR
MRVLRPALTAGPASTVVQDPKAPSTPLLAIDTEWTSHNRPRGINRVPTHTVGRAQERRAYVRARLSLRLRLGRVAGQRHIQQHPLQTSNISSSGLFFLSPMQIDPGVPIEIDVELISRPLSRATVYMSAAAHVVRSESSEQAGWYGVAATFDEIHYRRDEGLPDEFSM